jgi:hypothetical protein
MDLAHEIGGNLAGAKSGHLDLRRDLADFRVDARVDVLGRDEDAETALQAAVVGLGDVHDVVQEPLCKSK